MNFQYIKTDEQLLECCEVLKACSFLALDTEFVRVTSFYPALGLIQISSGKAHFLIDPLEIKNWTAFIALFDEKEFFFHACGEDVELFQYYFKQIPKKILDTQIMSFFLGATSSISYASLVEKYCGIVLDKTEKRTDWLARPLSKDQCRYAINDVIYLAEIALIMKQELQQKNLLDAAYEECQNFVTHRTTPKFAEASYLGIKKAYQLNQNEVPYLKALSKWRFEMAQKENKAQSFILHDDTLFNLAKYRPKSFSDYAHYGIYGKKIKQYGQEINKILRQNLEPEDKIILIEKTKEYKILHNELREKGEKISLETGLNLNFLVQKRHVIDYVHARQGNHSALPVFLKGWRAALFK